MIVYVAGASRELERAEAFIRGLRLRGHDVTHDWTVQVRAHRIVGGKSDEQLDDTTAADIAQAELDAVLQAEAFVLLVPKEGAFGAGVEFGVALAARIFEHPHRLFPLPIILAGGHRSVFTRLCDANFATDVEALDRIDIIEKTVESLEHAIRGWRCRRCGCSQNDPCEGGCAWAAPNLCDRCVPPAGEDEPPRIVRP